MKIINLIEDSKMYTSNVFLVLGTWNAVPDMNTLIDVGCDTGILNTLKHINTGLGKNKIDQIILTHSHSDHSALLPDIIKKFSPKVYACNPYLAGVTNVLHDGDMIKIGDSMGEVFHITAHSNDSICLYFEKEEILFAGDTKFPIKFDNEILAAENKQVLSRLNRKSVRRIYYGHGSAFELNHKRFHTI